MASVHVMEHKPRQDPFTCSIEALSSFLQHMLEQGHAFSTLKVNLAAISACHVGWNGATPGANPLATRFIKGTKRLCSPRSVSVPLWGMPFEPFKALI